MMMWSSGWKTLDGEPAHENEVVVEPSRTELVGPQIIGITSAHSCAGGSLGEVGESAAVPDTSLADD